MRRRGVPLGIDSNTVLALDFEDASLSDASGNSNDATAVGTPTYHEGYFGDGAYFPSTSDYLSVAQSASLDISGDMTIDFLCRVDGSGSQNALARNGVGANYAWAIAVNASAGQISFFVRNSSTLLDSAVVSNIGDFRRRWVNIRCVFDAGTALYVMMDGNILMKKTTTNADLQTTSVPDLLIGKQYNSGGSPSGGFDGWISNIRIRSAVDAEPKTMAVRLGKRITRRQIVHHHIDVSEALEGETWTTSGSNFYLALADIDAGYLIGDWDDIVGVESTTSGTTTTFTEVGTEADLGSNNWYWDETNGRLYSSEDPEAADTWKVTLRYRASNLGTYHGGRYYRPTVLSSDAGERSTAMLFRPYPAGGGSTVVLATQYGEHPDGFFSESASSVLWTHAPMRSWMLGDSVSWSERIPTFTGIVDEQPETSLDQTSIKALSEQAKLHKATVESATVNETDFPNAPQASLGHVFPAIWGPGHKLLTAVCVDDTVVSNQTKYKVSAHKITRLASVTWPDGRTNLSMSTVDLSDGTFFTFPPLNTNRESDPSLPVYVDVDGYGTASTATDAGPIFEFGSVSDTLTSAKDMLQEFLVAYVGYASGDFGSTWTGTDGRVQMSRRAAEVQSEGAALNQMIQHLLTETMSFLYFAANGTPEWEDVNKADASDWTLADPDVVSESFFTEREWLSKKAVAEAYAYIPKNGVGYKVGSPRELTLESQGKYDVRETFYPPPNSELTWIAHADDVSTYLANIRNFLEQPTVFYEVIAGARFLRAEIMDVVTVSTTSKPTDAGSRFRILRVKPEASGNVRMTMVDEANFATDGTTTVAGRDLFHGVHQFALGDDGGIPLAGGSDGTWQAVGTHETAYQGALASYPTVTHRMQLRAQRSGGAADTDLQVRLRDVTNNATVCTQDIGTSLGFHTASTSVTMPSTSARCRWQFKTESGASGTLYAVSVSTDETAATITDPVSPVTFWDWGNKDGEDCTVAASLTRVPNHEGGFILPPIRGVSGTRYQYLLYADDNGATDFVVKVVAVDPILANATIADFGTISAAGFYTAEPTAWRVNAPMFVELQYTCASGTGKVYSVSLMKINSSE